MNHQPNGLGVGAVFYNLSIFCALSRALCAKGDAARKRAGRRYLGEEYEALQDSHL